jgi:hypothetical protein|tara:strand:- start:2366 stop:3250 length:885 start_codon:yes stop_codon:yes gene_type:complete
MTTQKPKRAESLKELEEIQGKLFSPEEFGKGLKLKLRPDDVIISPFGKSGTTWLQQIVHTLRTRGDMDFDDISRVVPWIETSSALGIDLDAEQKSNPRAFKSHLDYETIPKGGKYIVSIRNPEDALNSMYKFMEGWFIEPGSISLEEFALKRFIASQSYWKHLASWWTHRNDTNVLMLCYEQMTVDPDALIRRVAEFIDVPLDDELLAITLEHSSFSYMLEHKDRFDDALMRALSETKANLPKGSDSSKVRKGKIGETSMPEVVQAELDEKWRQLIKETLGFVNYAELVAELNH